MSHILQEEASELTAELIRRLKSTPQKDWAEVIKPLMEHHITEGQSRREAEAHNRELREALREVIEQVGVERVLADALAAEFASVERAAFERAAGIVMEWDRRCEHAETMAARIRAAA